MEQARTCPVKPLVKIPTGSAEPLVKMTTLSPNRLLKLRAYLCRLQFLLCIWTKALGRPIFTCPLSCFVDIGIGVLKIKSQAPTYQSSEEFLDRQNSNVSKGQGNRKSQFVQGQAYCQLCQLTLIYVWLCLCRNSIHYSTSEHHVLILRLPKGAIEVLQFVLTWYCSIVLQIIRWQQSNLTAELLLFRIFHFSKGFQN